MKLALALFLIPSLACAQVGQIVVAVVPTPGGGSCTGGYQGVADIASTSLVSYYALRGVSCAYSTGANNAIQIQRASDNTTANIKILASGALDVATASTFCAATTCGIKTFYDQVGSNNLTQSTLADMEALSFSCIGSLPCWTSNGSQWAEGGTGTLAQPLTVISVLNISSSAGDWVFGVNTIFATGNNTTTFQGFAGSIGGVSGVSLSAWHNTLVAFLNNGAADYYVDNLDNLNVITGSNSLPSPYDIGGLATGGASGATFKMTELGLSSIAVTAGTYASVCAQQAAYWGNGVTC